MSEEDILWTRENNPQPFALPLDAGTVRINVPALFKRVFGREPHPVYDHARMVLFTNRIADFMNEQSHRWRHRLMTPAHLAELRSMLVTHGLQLRDEGV